MKMDSGLCAKLTEEENVWEVLALSGSDSDSKDDVLATVLLPNIELMQVPVVLLSAYSDAMTLAKIQADVIVPK